MSDSTCMAFIGVIYILLVKGKQGMKNRFSEMDAEKNFEFSLIASVLISFSDVVGSQPALSRNQAARDYFSCASSLALAVLLAIGSCCSCYLLAELLHHQKKTSQEEQIPASEERKSTEQGIELPFFVLYFFLCLFFFKLCSLGKCVGL